MSTKNNTRARAGDVIHALDAMTAFGLVLVRGDTLTLTPDHVELSTDRNGNSWLSDLADEAQIARWGRVRIGLGTFPADLQRWTYGDPEWAEQREAARKRAWRVDDPTERAAARERVEAEYGPAPSTSRTTNKAPSVPQRPSGNVGR